MKIVTVIPLSKSALKEDLTYFTAKEIPDGSIVEIPLRNKKVLGIAVTSEEVSGAKSDIKNMSFNLRKILDVKEHSIFRDEFIKTSIEISRYFAAPKGLTLNNLLPGVFRENYDKLAETEKKEPEVKSKKISSLKSEKLLFQAPLEDRIASYKTLIRSSFAEKKSVFMVLPSSRDIDIFKETLSRGIEKFVLPIHPNMPVKKQIEQFKNILNTEHPILILGTPQFLSIPRHDISTIILEHESRASYKMFTRPYLDFRTFAELLAQKMEAKFIYADTLLRFETIARQEEFGDVHSKTFRLNFEGDINLPHPDPLLIKEREKFKVISDENLEEIKKIVEKKQNVFIFSLRKGLATHTLCRDCGETLMCEKCSSPVVLYLSGSGKKMFVCNRCKSEKDPEMKCPNCQSWNLMPLGIGTDTVEEEIKKHFNKEKIFKLDKESAKSSSGAEKIIKEFEKSKGAILIGTEMAFFYLKERVPLSLIASFDSLWSIPNFKMSEKILHVIFSMASITYKKIIIQTKNERDPVLKAIKNESLLNLVREELEDRKTLRYPPFARFIKISYLGSKEDMLSARKKIKEIFAEYNPEIFSGFVSKLKGKYATNALLKLDPKKWSLPELSTGSSVDQNLLAKLSSLPPSFSINVDPEDLL